MLTNQYFSTSEHTWQVLQVPKALANPLGFFNVFRYPLQFGGSDNSCIFGKVCVIVDKSIL